MSALNYTPIYLMEITSNLFLHLEMCVHGRGSLWECKKSSKNLRYRFSLHNDAIVDMERNKNEFVCDNEG